MSELEYDKELFSVEFPPNDKIAIIHTFKKVSDSIELYPKCQLSKKLAKINGVTNAYLCPFEVRIERAVMHSFEKILPEVFKILTASNNKPLSLVKTYSMGD